MKKGRDNVELVCSVAELGSLFTQTHSLDQFLDRVVDTVARHMRVPVCSIYLYDDDKQELVLRSTRGLSPESVGSVRLRIGEGITGTALKELRPIRECRASTNPNFKFFAGIGEEKYEAFLAVPIVRGLRKIGVLVVQHRACGYFDETDATALRAISSQLAGAIENTKLFLDLTDKAAPPAPKDKEHDLGTSLLIKGIPGSRGFACGQVAFYGILSREEGLLAAAQDGESDLTIGDFERALQETEKELETLQAAMERQALDLQASLIFNAHLLMLKDPSFSNPIRERIESGHPVGAAVLEVVSQFVSVFKSSANPRLREKVQDVNDLGHRLLRNLTPGHDEVHDYRRRIVVAGQLLPSDMLKISTQKAAGLIIAEGSFTAHISILARSLDIPLVVAKDSRLFQLSEREILLIDAGQGTIYVNPDKTVTDHYDSLAAARRQRPAQAFDSGAGSELHTADQVRIRVFANINLISEIALARELGAEGIGLYRSEFPFLVRNDFPQEEEQYRIYKKIIEEMEGRDVVFRTLDVGGDKMLSYFPTVNEANPFLGLRAIRFSLQYKEIFRQQLNALLRAGGDRENPPGIMFPMISSVDDFLQVRSIVGECREKLLAAGKIRDSRQPRLGIMIELPAAVELAGELARVADFLCLGTNDLVQYMLAADRTNPDISHYYAPHHPAVLRALHRVTAAARAEDTPLSICGEIANQANLVPFLIGIGIRDFSLDPHGIPHFREIVRELRAEQAEKDAARLLRLATLREVEKTLLA